jgi:DNA-binding MarR family transcriptional regulator
MDMPPWEQRPGYLMSAVGAHVQIRFAELLAPYGLLPHHFGLLRRVSTQDGRTQQDLADAMQLRRAAVVGVVDDLEALGLLERRRHPVDRRANALHLTLAGRRLVAKLSTAITALENELLDPLPPQARTAFVEGLRQVAVVAGVADGVYPHPVDQQSDPEPAVSSLRDTARAGRAIPARRPRTDRKA